MEPITLIDLKLRNYSNEFLLQALRITGIILTAYLLVYLLGDSERRQFFNGHWYFIVVIWLVFMLIVAYGEFKATALFIHEIKYSDHQIYMKWQLPGKYFCIRTHSGYYSNPCPRWKEYAIVTVHDPYRGENDHAETVL